MSSLLHPDQRRSALCTVNGDSIVELARNTANLVKCDWGTGTKAECIVVLGSWMLLKKHLQLVHCHQSDRNKSGYVCRLSKCNCNLHFSRQALLDHVDSAHLSRIPLVCPIPDCISLNFKGEDYLVKHFGEKHGDLIGKVIEIPATDTRPIMKNNTTDVRGEKSASLPPLPRGREIQPGSALVMNVGIKQKMEFVDKDEWFGSQFEMSQSQAFTSSQGQGLVTRRLRTRAKQLEKVKKKEDEEEDEEGVASIWLDDLTSLGLANGPRIDVDVRRRRSRWVGLRGKGSVGRDNLPLATMVEQGMIFGQGSQRLMMDLSRPQPMLEPEVLSKGGEEARAPRSILFEVAARKVDERENLMGAPSTSC